MIIKLLKTAVRKKGLIYEAAGNGGKCQTSNRREIMQVHCYESPAESTSYAQVRLVEGPLLKSLILFGTLAILLFVMSLAIFLVTTRPVINVEPATTGGNGGGPAFALISGTDQLCQELRT